MANNPVVLLFKGKQCVQFDPTENKKPTPVNIIDYFPKLKGTKCEHKVDGAVYLTDSDEVVFLSDADSTCYVYPRDGGSVQNMPVNVYFNECTNYALPPIQAIFRWSEYPTAVYLFSGVKGAGYERNSGGVPWAGVWNGGEVWGYSAHFAELDAATQLETGNLYFFNNEQYYVYPGKTVGTIADLWRVPKPFDGSDDGIDAALTLPTPMKGSTSR